MQSKLTVNCVLPERLYRYSERRWLERALEHGEFLLKPASSFKDMTDDGARQDDELSRVRQSDPHEVTILHSNTGKELKPIGPVRFETKSSTDYLIICFSKKWDPAFFTDFKGSDACLVVNQVEKFKERLHSAVENLPPGWTRFGAAVHYGKSHDLGMWFSKSSSYAYQEERRFAWLPKVSEWRLCPTVVTIGSITDIAEIKPEPA